jgi:NitT/TauT family transport system ATP-binding protein
MAALRFEQVSKEFRRRASGSFLALDDINLTIEAGELVAVIGPSGCGKTTLLNVAASLEAATRGQVLLDDRVVTKPGRDRGVVFQQDALFMWRTVQRNVEYGLETQRLDRAERAERARRWLGLVGLEDFADFLPKELSGGMKKRCQIAAVLANEPELILMDEPYGALDYPTKVQLQELLQRILMERPRTTMFVTHDVEEALFLADRVVAMDTGRIAEIIDVPFARPRTEELRLSAEFAAAKSRLWARLSSGSDPAETDSRRQRGDAEHV